VTVAVRAREAEAGRRAADDEERRRLNGWQGFEPLAGKSSIHMMVNH
jgi:hypothetical protein